MSVEQLVQTLILGCLDREQTSLRLWSEVAQELGCDITASSLDERLTYRLVGVLYEVLQGCIGHQLVVPQLPIKQLEELSRMLIIDSTAIQLPSALKDEFHGRSDVALGQLKLQVCYDYLAGQVCLLEMREGVEPDQVFHDWLAQMEAQALFIFDLGYFSQAVLDTLNRGQAYFLTRYQSQTNLYEPETGAAIDLEAYLQQTTKTWIEMEVLLGAQVKTNVRLLARRVHPQELEARRRRAKREALKKGRTPSPRSLFLCDWEILVTNLPAHWTIQQVFDLYRVRWQIELLFKGWKSYLEVNVLGSYRAERVLCQLFASLIGAILCQATFALLRFSGSETSFFKSIHIIRRFIARLPAIIRRHWFGILAWGRDLCSAILKFGQQQNLEASPSSLRRLIYWGLS